MMGVSYVTTDHIKSHLQKYRMQMKKSDDIISSSPAMISNEQEAEKKKKKRKNQTKSEKDNTKQLITVEEKKCTESIEPAQNIASCSASSTGQSSNNSIGFNNWMQSSNSGSSSSTTTTPFTMGVEQHVSERDNEQHHNEASNSNFSFLKKVFTHSAESFLFDNTNSQSSFLIPSLSNLASEEITSNHLSVFAESNAKDNLNISGHSLGFNIQNDKEFVTSSAKESEKNQYRQVGQHTLPQQTNQNNGEAVQADQTATPQATSFLEQYSSLLFDMCRTDEEVRQLFLEAKHLAKSDDHFIFILHGFRLGVLSGLRMAKQQHK
ncbi:hypothetical protein C9374_008605 [Naegleria lovaniensis]|uniref:Uncharacterized protein n=1 Tax=Naegleria lovaniensis TaxID=51637 RepID=A0AA88KHM4_NAELO|nr:uncharacterized protein C9374_008605 [Naegleria lovaniensis]KAG2377983.1 hypothetical protein C9374_008605 [Naegleria lovaniensis]